MCPRSLAQLNLKIKEYSGRIQEETERTVTAKLLEAQLGILVFWRTRKNGERRDDGQTNLLSGNSVILNNEGKKASNNFLNRQQSAALRIS